MILDRPAKTHGPVRPGCDGTFWSSATAPAGATPRRRSTARRANRRMPNARRSLPTVAGRRRARRGLSRRRRPGPARNRCRTATSRPRVLGPSSRRWTIRSRPAPKIELPAAGADQQVGGVAGHRHPSSRNPRAAAHQGAGQLAGSEKVVGRQGQLSAVGDHGGKRIEGDLVIGVSSASRPD